MSNPLYDSEFLLKLDKNHAKETYARITALSWQEDPLEYIEGRITSGTINIDGSSSLQRTCNLTLVAQDINLTNYYWGLHTKFKLEVGVKNTIDNRYPEIIWFPQGIYILTTFNTNVATNNYTINLSGKDKMCMLNGDVGGQLTASIDFGVEEFVDKETNTITYTSIPIKTIIRNAVHVWGNEPLHNIIINDVDDYGYELLEYRGSIDTPLYLLKNINSDTYVNMTMKGNQPCYYGTNFDKKTTLSALEHYDVSTNGGEEGITKGTPIKLKKDSDIIYTVKKISYGDTAGYRLTDLTYAGDLISSIGDSLTSILDKIKQMLGIFEYFYDVEGRFIFQKKKTYVQNNWNNQVYREDDMYVESTAYTSALSYVFYDSHYFTSISHNPTMNNLRNDFSIWGSRKGITGGDIPIHMRYALDRKPVYYKNFKGDVYTNETYDWREIIYQMALDYFKYANGESKYREINITSGEFLSNPTKYYIYDKDKKEYIKQTYSDSYSSSTTYYDEYDHNNFLLYIVNNNPDYYPTGYTGYEQYYTDMQGFWRDLYNPVILKASIPEEKVIYYIQTLNENNNITYVKPEGEIITTISPDRTKQYYDAYGNKYYQAEDFSFSRDKEYYLMKDGKLERVNILKFINPNVQYYYQEKGENYDINSYWNWNVTNNPAVLNFWFDFLGEGSELDRYMVPSMGSRTKAINDDKITGIYFKETPDVLFITEDEYIALAGAPMKSGYTYIRINDSLSGFFNISAQGKSAQNVMEELLYENTYCIETVTINSIPIFYLNPNVRIGIKDERSNINSEYIVSKITLPLTYNGTMSLTATRAADTIY